MSKKSSKLVGPLARCVKSLLSGLLRRLLPTRTKRLILFASLSARLCDDKTKFNSATLHKLNAVMALSNEDQALALPVHLSRVIWKKDSGNVVLYPTQMDTKPTEDVINAILNEIPSWLKYGNRKGMREDLVQLMRNQELITS